MMKIFLNIGFLVLPFILAAQSDIIMSETFDYPDGSLPGNWWSEGCPGQIKDGHLYVDADTTSYRMSTIWLDKEFGGDFTIEYDAHVISSVEKKNNINCMLLYSYPGGKSIRETRGEREDGLYNRYHKLNGYIFTYVANGNEDTARYRFRYNPYFQLMEENFGYNCRIGETYHVKIVKIKNQFQFWVDGNKMIEKTVGDDHMMHESGLFGFRTWHSAVWWDNLCITRLE